jgi:hypothetical protein
MMKRNMADMAGRAMKGRTDDKMGRAMAAPRPVRGGVMAAKKGGMMKSKGNGGSASKRADGVASKGKTKGKMVKMAYGGKC